mmetsp:Transcript_26239/g.53776  ORF Transcript_26239/g.53776 Transcript_26239/m.53776 type:complete len:338 (+) Transcript_26239:567-1580(+)
MLPHHPLRRSRTGDQNPGGRAPSNPPRRPRGSAGPHPHGRRVVRRVRQDQRRGPAGRHTRRHGGEEPFGYGQFEDGAGGREFVHQERVGESVQRRGFDAGGHRGPHPRRRKVRPRQRLPLLHLRHVLDPRRRQAVPNPPIPHRRRPATPPRDPQARRKDATSTPDRIGPGAHGGGIGNGVRPQRTAIGAVRTGHGPAVLQPGRRIGEPEQAGRRGGTVPQRSGRDRDGSGGCPKSRRHAPSPVPGARSRIPHRGHEAIPESARGGPAPTSVRTHGRTDVAARVRRTPDDRGGESIGGTQAGQGAEDDQQVPEEAERADRARVGRLRERAAVRGVNVG